MNTAKLTSAIVTFSLVLFMSIASVANSINFYSGDLTKSGNKSLSVANTSERDFSYLRFDVNKYVNENEITEITDNPLDYLRFDINEFINETGAETTELPLADEFDYLRFDVNKFTENNSGSMNELPVNEFDYLRFDVNNFAASGNTAIDVLPETE